MNRLAWISLVLLTASASAETIAVGDGKATLADAVRRAKAGDVIEVHESETQYRGQGVVVKTPKLKIVGVGKKAGAKVTIDGGTFNYSGRGSVPRGIFQFDPGASDCVLENFELSGAHNESHNGAGVRVNAANNVTIRNCVIRGNDMGIMSNGEVSKKTGENLLIENCLITGNGAKEDPGYNHNLYLGGTSVRLLNCEISKSLTGHNLKSRAHLTWVEACYIHDSANRELDLVDQKGNTDVEKSDAVILGTVIVKAAGMNGNKTVIHFGQDGKNEHNGTVYLVHSTVITPYASPVVDLSSAGAGVKIFNSVVADGSGRVGKQTLVGVRSGAKVDLTGVRGNLLGGGFGEIEGNSSGGKVEFPGMGRGEFAVPKGAWGEVKTVPLEKMGLPEMPGGGKVVLQRFGGGAAKGRRDAGVGAWE